jgi:hypothetical protein
MTSSKIFRALSAVFLVNSTEFAKASPTEQTEVLLESSGRTVLFVKNFLELQNKRVLRDKLLAGSDVSTELEFNGITLTDGEMAALRAVKPILAKIDGIEEGYPWLGEAVSEGRFQFHDRYGVKLHGSSSHWCRVKTAKKMWDAASKYWGTGERTPVSKLPSSFDGYRRTPEIHDNKIVIGCQSITRAEAEFIAKHYGWEPNV